MVLSTPITTSRRFGLAVLCAFFASGAAGLVHEIAWSRLLRLVMGNTTFTITTVLCAFMGGLALGSYWGGRIIDRRNDPLRVFAILECTIAIYCLILPLLIDIAEPLYRIVYQSYQQTQTTFYVLSLIRFAICGALLLIPATFMGATLPVLSRFFVQSSDRVGLSVGTLYAINTFGAVLGVAMTGFVLIPALGVTKTIYLACTLNALVGIIGYWLHRQTLSWAKKTHATQTPASTTQVDPPDFTSRYGRHALTILLIGYGVSGFAALAYEVAWSRILSMMIGSSVYAFSMMLTAFILGLALGSMIFARFVDRLKDPMFTLAIIEVGIGLSALAVVPVFGELPFWVTHMLSRIGDSFWLRQWSQFGLVIGIMLVPTILMGAAFPLASRIMIQSSSTVGRSIGSLYGCNTLGSILGTFLAGFVLIPSLGLQDTILLAVTANVMVGCAFILQTFTVAPRLRGLICIALIMLMSTSVMKMPDWNNAYMSMGPFVMSRRLTVDEAQSHAFIKEKVDSFKTLYH